MPLYLMRYAAIRRMVKSCFFRNGMPVGARSVANRVASSVPLHSVYRLNAGQRAAEPHYMDLGPERDNNVYKTLSLFRPFEN